MEGLDEELAVKCGGASTGLPQTTTMIAIAKLILLPLT